jgi:hypothetical protein
MYILEIISYNEVQNFYFGPKVKNIIIKTIIIIGFDKTFRINNIINPNISSFVSY